MSYATIEDIKVRLADFVDLYTDGAGDFQSEWAEADILSASAELDGMIGMRYRLPITALPALSLLKNWCLTLVEELAWSRAGGKGETPENVRTRVAVIRGYLEKISAGTMKLAGAVETDSGSVAEVDVAEPQFTRDKLKGY